MGDIAKIAENMQLKCNEGCDHGFCLTSFTGMTFSKTMISRGPNGKLYKCKESQSEREFALKIIDAPDQIKYVEANINNFQYISHHERIITYYGNFENNNKLYIFMEFINGGSLKDKISEKNPIPHEEVVKYTKQILEGVSFLHNNKILHRDIQPANILMLKSGDIKICDFGESRKLSDPQPLDKHSEAVYTKCGTYNYMAPEIINAEPYLYPIDIWSVGATFVAMVTGKHPYGEVSSVKAAEKISSSKTIVYTPIKPLSSEMQELVNDMLQSNPLNRPTASDLLKYKIFS